MKPNIEIILGTYEEFLLGYKIAEKDGKLVLSQSFADNSHSGALKSIAVRGPWIASGGTDDRIFIYDMRSRQQVQILMSHNGTINALDFVPDGTHLLSAGQDGRLLATRTDNWSIDANWKKAHNGAAVTHVSCHPSSKMALSLSADLVLITWNLIKGRVAYKTNLKSRNTLGLTADCLVWSPLGNYFTIAGQQIIEIWSIKSADVIHSQKAISRPISVTWIDDESCIFGLENGKLSWISLSDDKKEVIFDAHKSRVKAISAYKDSLITVSSDGELKLWELNSTKRQISELAVIKIGCRPTCIGILDLDQFGEESVAEMAVVDDKLAKSSNQENVKNESKTASVTVEYENDETGKQDEGGSDSSSSSSEDCEGENVSEAIGDSFEDDEKTKTSINKRKNKDRGPLAEEKRKKRK